MVKAKNLKQVPMIRFPGFKGEWERGVLSEIANINPKSKALPKEFIYIDLESVTKGNFSEGLSINRDEAPSRAQRVMEKCDILYQTVRPYQRNNLFFNREGNYVASTGYAQIRAKGEPLFLYQLLHTTPFVNTAMKWSTGTSYPAISSFDLVKIPISCPTLPEQEKIASFLSAVDKKIQQLTARKELLEQYKKGVMQKIFSQEIRFTDDNGKDYPDWEKKDFGEMVKKTKTKYNPVTDDGDFPCIEMESIAKENGILLEVFSSKKQKSIKNKFKNGDILFGKLRPNLKKYLIAPFDGVCSSEIWVLTGINVLNDYLFALIQTNRFYRISNVTSGSKMPRSDWDYISTSPFTFPTIPEQQKIASFLSSIDKKIESVQSQITQTQTFKKGLLQQLFV